ncbi:hypothetical protein CEP54_011695 [Fusarium duplospermum]|uniref:F-box domain-containing protein n=1 Tax=Fusarium duplospermum TaxID=1325734 RepID=A0A428PD22_9HYPO|nr:hypothetical protein CEP54_011695 [Fusarium duplospermum]
MTDLLRTLPREVFLLILAELPKRDLKSLSSVSRWLRNSVAERLWGSITIRARDESRLSDIRTSGLPQSCLQHTKKLHFLADCKEAIWRRCPHYDAFCNSPSSGLDTNDDEGRRETFHFDRLVRKAQSLLERIEPGQLQSFSWDLGVCGPADIFGDRGILPLQQPLLRTLSLITDPTCLEHHAACRDRHIDLSSFRQLRNLTWRGPGPENLDTLGAALRNNSAHLKRLELDFVNRFIAFNYDSDATDVSDASDDSDVQDEMENTRVIRKKSVFASAVLRLTHYPQRPLFRNICVLSLTQVPLSGYMADAFNFDTLESLTLRMCPWWDLFLDRVMQLDFPIKLRAFEILEDTDIAFEWSDDIILDFLDAFGGLEELCISQTGPARTLDLWDTLGRRHPTLKRFVHHQRRKDIDDVFQPPTDLPNLALVGSDMRRIKEDPSRNPLTQLDLEFIGLACKPARLVSLRP